MTQLLTEIRSHFRSGLLGLRGDKGDDVFIVNVPPLEVYDKVQLTILEATSGGKALVAAEPLVGQSGQLSLKVRWFHNAFGKIRYRIEAFSKAAFNTAPADGAHWQSVQDKIANGHQDGVHGFYLKRVGGNVVLACNEELIFDPASSIKVLVHAHALRRLQADAVSLDTTVIPIPGNLTLPQPRGVNCPFDEENSATDTLPLTLRRALEAMMLRSRNAPTEAIRRFFGAGNVQNTARDVGLNNTRYDNAPGCGQNKTTLVDLGKLYEAAATSGRAFHTSPLALNWATFIELAWHEPIPEMDAIVAAAAPGLGPSIVDTHRRLVTNVNKSGRGGDQTGQKISLAGYIALPFRARRGGGIGMQEFVYGVFVDKASGFAAGFKQVEVLMEMLRPAIGESVGSLG